MEDKRDTPQLNIVVVGDGGVGKTSIISCYVTRQLDNTMVLDPVTIPPDRGSRWPDHPRGVQLRIVDTSSDKTQNELTNEAMFSADVIVLVADCTQVSTLRRVSSEWVPRFNRLKLDCPVIVACNTKDSLDDQGLKDVMSGEEWRAIEDLWRVENILLCSATKGDKVKDLFLYAQSAVLYPMAPLRDIQSKKLTVDFERALVRMFRACDKDLDDALTYEELNTYQKTVTSIETQRRQEKEEVLEKKVWNSILTMLRRTNPLWVREEGPAILYPGFRHLQQRYIDQNRPQFCWQALKAFGYTMKTLPLTINPSYFSKLPSGSKDQSFELTPDTSDFLSFLFMKYDPDEIDELAPEELPRLFEPVPEEEMRFVYKEVENVEMTNTGSMLYGSWTALWSTIALLYPEQCMKLLTYLGLPLSSTALMRTKGKRGDRTRKDIDRLTLRGYVFGSRQSGKSMFINRLIGVHDKCPPTTQLRYVANEIFVDETVRCTLLLTEVPSDKETIARVIKDELPYHADILILLYDVSDPHSLNFILELMQPPSGSDGKLELPDYLPVQFVGTKNDRVVVDQLASNPSPQQGSPRRDDDFSIESRPKTPPRNEQILNIVKICDDFNITYPVMVKPLDNFVPFFQNIGGLARYPEISRPRIPRKEFQRKMWRLFGRIAVVGGLGIGIGYYLYAKNSRRQITSPSVSATPPAPSTTSSAGAITSGADSVGSSRVAAAGGGNSSAARQNSAGSASR